MVGLPSYPPYLATHNSLHPFKILFIQFSASTISMPPVRRLFNAEICGRVNSHSSLFPVVFLTTDQFLIYGNCALTFPGKLGNHYHGFVGHAFTTNYGLRFPMKWDGTYKPKKISILHSPA